LHGLTVSPLLRARYLIQHGADTAAFDVVTRRDVLTWSCFLDRTPEALRIMAEQSGDTDFQRRDSQGRTALHYATVNGNLALVTAIVTYMRKYNIPMDIRDEDGFTPYILARRLGQTEAAKVLANGGASTQLMDSKNHRSVREWSWIKDREKSFMVHKNQDRALGTYKILGRLPEIKAAKFNPEEVKIVKSKVDKNFLHQSYLETSRNKSRDLFRQKTWLDFDKLKARHTRSLPELKDLQRLQTEETRLVLPKTKPKTREVLPTYVFKTPMTWEQSNNDKIHSMMTMLGSQYAHSYRPVAKPKLRAPPVPPPILKRSSDKKRKKERRSSRKHSRRESVITSMSFSSSVAVRSIAE
jgi:hypothetical protein